MNNYELKFKIIKNGDFFLNYKEKEIAYKLGNMFGNVFYLFYHETLWNCKVLFSFELYTHYSLALKGNLKIIIKGNCWTHINFFQS